MVLLRCAIVGDERVFTINMGAKHSVARLHTLISEKAQLPYGGFFLDVYQARQFGITGNAFLTTKHLDYEDLSCGNEQVKAVYLTKEMLMHDCKRIKDYIRVSSAPDAIHVLVKLPTPEELAAQRRRIMMGGRSEASSESTKREECVSDSIWTSISRSVSSWFATATHEKKNE